jgi:hypothetical protein
MATLFVPELRAESSVPEAVGAGGSIRAVNVVGGLMNCANCAVAADATLAGRAASALPGGATQASQLAQELGGSWLPTNGIGGATKVMQGWGSGSRAIVFGGRNGGVGHFFNVVNQRGTIRFLDGQAGGAANVSVSYDGYWLLRTN